MVEGETTSEGPRLAEIYRRRDISLRADRRKLETRERGILFVLSGIYLYWAIGIAITVFSLLAMGLWSRAWLGIFLGSLIGIACVVAVIKMWLPKPPVIWLVALPCAMNLLTSTVFGFVLSIGFALDLLAGVLIYALYRTWLSQSMLRSRHEELRSAAAVVSD